MPFRPRPGVCHDCCGCCSSRHLHWWLIFIVSAIMSLWCMDRTLNKGPRRLQPQLRIFSTACGSTPGRRVCRGKPIPVFNFFSFWLASPKKIFARTSSLQHWRSASRVRMFFCVANSWHASAGSSCTVAGSPAGGRYNTRAEPYGRR